MASMTPAPVKTALGSGGGMGEPSPGGATVDIGALMRKKRQTLLIPSSGIGGGGLSSARIDKTAVFSEAQNPIYSPDDSLAKAASKLQSLKALRASVPRLAQPPTAALEPNVPTAVPAPQHCDSPRLHGSSGQACDAGPQISSGEDSGELAAAAAASPRMTRAQRRKSMAVGKSINLEPGIARAALEEADAEEREQGSKEQQQPAKRPAVSRRKSMGTGLMIQKPSAQPQQQEEEEAASQRDPGLLGVGVAAEVAALCNQLDGFIEDSPEKRPGADSRSLRDKLLESWDGKTYYERLLEMSREKEEEEKEENENQAQQQVQQQQHKTITQPAKPTSRTPAAKAPASATSRTAAASVLACAQLGTTAAKPMPQLVPSSGSNIVAAAAASATVAAPNLLTPNTQRRKLNELTTSLHLLKVTSRHRAAQLAASGGTGMAPAASTTAATGREASPPLPPCGAASQPSASAADAGTASKAPRGRSATPVASASGSAEVEKARQGGGNAAAAQPAQASVGVAAASAPGSTALQAELTAAYEALKEAQAEKEVMAERAKHAEAAAAADRKARVAAEAEVDRLLAELVQAVQAQQFAADALKAAEQRSKQLAKEAADAQQVAAAAERAVAVERGLAAQKAAQMEMRWGEAEKALAGVLKAANAGMKAAASGREEAKAMAEACGGAENAAAGGANGDRSKLRQSGGRWR